MRSKVRLEVAGEVGGEVGGPGDPGGPIVKLAFWVFGKNLQARVKLKNLACRSPVVHLSLTFRSPRVAPHVAYRSPVVHLSLTYRSTRVALHVAHLSFTCRSPIAHLSLCASVELTVELRSRTLTQPQRYFPRRGSRAQLGTAESTARSTSLWGGCCQLPFRGGYRPGFETWLRIGTWRVARF